MTSEIDRVIRSLEWIHLLREALLTSAIRVLHLPPNSRGLDIGCGIGDPALLLADATIPNGQVVALDISRGLLDYARQKTKGAGGGDPISFLQGDMGTLPFAAGTVDWAWSVDCVGYPAADLLPILMGIRRVVRPGGVIALLAWTSQQLLPGHPMLEARLNATCSAYAPFLEGQPPRAHFPRALHWFSQAGLSDPTCGTFVAQVNAPMGPSLRDGMALLFEMLWADGIGHASQADFDEYRRLCSPTSPDFVVDVPEYCGFFTYTMFTGRVPAIR
jgi:demethylmenaquinone methyltransferase / 2-methoxy-6-polyprenyl-1,4-benzoquinol methylase